MSPSEVELLSRAHRLFAAARQPPQLSLDSAHVDGLPQPTPAVNDGYRLALRSGREGLRSAARIDAAAAALIAGAHRDHAFARSQTGSVVGEARAEAAATPDTPIAQREALRRRVARLRAQRMHVLGAHARARRHLAVLRALRYRATRRRATGLLRLSSPNGRAGIAVRAALSRLGRPYVWGATGPNQFDCSGLMQWSYNQAGIHLSRTTYQQIHEGIPVPRGQVRPGDLVFPHAGHVQMALGNNLVVEAPHAGAAVRISPLGSNVQIRRPLS
ncbi:hypothetical protein A5707_21550 [Mycobacterium kyorinense]|uniref:NlpC/P60 domain-containing protein n=1 Tax=Mycobacterium kyorinense TaxID=487514 RepID=A0A1A2ZBC9_9MYCO|nr:C40 family peptidase [Mycobacterium kyorinense]OBI46411.1 hypothetical protein A5707_21550 [Mycobacterium kyorinense]